MTRLGRRAATALCADDVVRAEGRLLRVVETYITSIGRPRVDVVGRWLDSNEDARVELALTARPTVYVA